MGNVIIDRRRNPTGKNTTNRKRFVDRSKGQIQKSIRDRLTDRDISDSDSGQDVNISNKGLTEPEFSYNGKTGNKDYVVPGNKDFVPGDRIKKPPAGGEGDPQGGSPDGEGDDDFEFNLTQEEFLELLFDDLELPDLLKKAKKSTVSYKLQRAGHSAVGSPSNLNLEKSMINSFGRRLALRSPKYKRIKKLQEEIEQLLELPETEEREYRIQELHDAIRRLKIAAKAVAFVDPIDLRYNNFEKQPQPSSQAVVFFIMDVSASMGAKEKDLAKRFFLILNLFLQRQYKTVDIVFIRHHTIARVCDEEDFFYNKESGGTIVSTAFEEMKRVVKEDYPLDDWNIYVSQASDGDNFIEDNAVLNEMIQNEILPIVQYFAYIHVREDETYSRNNLMTIYNELKRKNDNMNTKLLRSPKHVYSAFREMFRKRVKVKK